MEQYKIKEKYRSVCSHCNMPLNELACEAVAEAKADPGYFFRAFRRRSCGN